MLPYVLIILLPFIMCRFQANKKKKNALYLNSEDCSDRNLGIPVFFVLLFIILALRSVSVGTDLQMYRDFWYEYKDARFIDIFSFNSENDVEKLYIFLNVLLGHITDNFQWLLVVIALFQTTVIGLFYQEDRRFSFLKISLFVNMATFLMLFSGLRQSISITLGLLAYKTVRNKKVIPFLITVALAVLMHRSAFILLFLYPICRIKFRKDKFWVYIVLFILVYIFKRYIFNSLLRFLPEYNNKYDVKAEDVSAFGMLILFFVFSVFSMVFVDEAKMTDEDFGMRNLILFAAVFQIFTTVNQLSMRFNYYFIIFIPVAVPKMLCCIDERYKIAGKIANVVMCLFFSVYFVYTVYTNYVSGGGLLDTVPYVPFWKG